MISRVVLRDETRRGWFEYTHPVEVIVARSVKDVLPALIDVEHLVRSRQLYAAGFVTYEAAAGFDDALPAAAPGFMPLLCFGLFSARHFMSSLPQSADSALGSWQSKTTRDAYEADVRSLRARIGAGDIYQVNYTTRFAAPGVLNFEAFIRMGADAPYGAFIDGPEFSVVSASPELFFTRQGHQIICKPMKGTAARGLDSAADKHQACWLETSAKNRAENLMITDMVRNDLSRIAQSASVCTPALFNVEQYPTVWQMTSTVTARTSASIADVFRALFPGASITGAPKRASMEFINSLENCPREIYTGAIGVLCPDGDAEFNIAIRTAWSNKREGISGYGSGGGIVWDSDPSDEFAELQAKTKVLTRVVEKFDLFETMLSDSNQGVHLLERHLARLSASALYFAFDFDERAARQAISELVAGLPALPHRVRLVLAKDGAIALQSSPLAKVGTAQSVQLAQTAVNAADVTLYHKTSSRKVYERAAGEVNSDCEAVLFNAQGRVTESVIANLVYRWQGVLYTPPVSDGLLPGTLRSELLACGEIYERSLSLDELPSVGDLYLISALRGWRRAKIVLPEESENLPACGWLDEDQINV